MDRTFRTHLRNRRSMDPCLRRGLRRRLAGFAGYLLDPHL